MKESVRPLLSRLFLTFELCTRGNYGSDINAKQQEANIYCRCSFWRWSLQAANHI